LHKFAFNFAILPDIVPVPTEQCSSTDSSSRAGKMENSQSKHIKKYQKISNIYQLLPTFTSMLIPNPSDLPALFEAPEVEEEMQEMPKKKRRNADRLSNFSNNTTTIQP